MYLKKIQTAVFEGSLDYKLLSILSLFDETLQLRQYTSLKKEYIMHLNINVLLETIF